MFCEHKIVTKVIPFIFFNVFLKCVYAKMIHEYDEVIWYLVSGEEWSKYDVGYDHYYKKRFMNIKSLLTSEELEGKVFLLCIFVIVIR